MRVSVLGAATLGAALNGCTLLFGTGDLEGSAPREDGSVSDVFANVADVASVADGGGPLDVSVAADVAQSSDARAEEADTPDSPASDAGMATTTSYCLQLSPTPLFCVDFDEHPLSWGWDNADASLTAGFSMGLFGDVAVSPPDSLRIDMAAYDGGPSPAASLYHYVQAAQPNVTLAFDVRIDSPDFPITDLAKLRVGGSSANFWLSTQNMYSAFGENLPDGASTWNPSAVYLPASTWGHVEMVLTNIGAASSRSVTITLQAEGGSVQTLLPPTPLESFDTAGDPEVNIGIVYLGGALPATSLHFDNVVLK